MQGSDSHWSKKIGSMEHYDKISKSYDEQYGEEQEEKIRTATKMVGKLRSGVVLDLGSGTGLLIPHLPDVDFLVEVDISLGMLRRGKEKALERMDVDFVQADADYTPFRPQSFNAVLAITLLQNMPQPEKTVKEAIRITEKGGKIVITALKKRFNLYKFLKILLKAGVRVVRIEVDGKLKDYVAIFRQENRQNNCS